jgi:hypothetical protein
MLHQSAADAKSNWIIFSLLVIAGEPFLILDPHSPLIRRLLAALNPDQVEIDRFDDDGGRNHPPPAEE